MKKTSIYLLSLLVIAVLALSVILPVQKIISTGFEAFSLGFKEGYSADTDEMESASAPIDIRFSPSFATVVHPTDSIMFKRDVPLPFVIGSGTVMVPDRDVPTWTQWCYLILVPLQIIVFIYILWILLRFIINVSHEKIFVKRNVSYLRRISYALYLISLLQIILGIIQNHVFEIFAFDWTGYELAARWDFPWSNLLLASIGLLFAQVWSYGLQIKQDQELTI